MDLSQQDLQYLRLLAKQHPSIRAAATEIINLNAMLELPKGTEHFISDIHGEYEAFLHALRNGSGSIKRKIDEIFADTLVQREKRNLASLIYYPRRKLPLILQEVAADDEEWYRITLFRLIRLCRVVASKYTRAQVREALPDDFAYIIEELLHEQESIGNRQEYYKSIIETIIATDRAKAFIIALAELIQRLAIARLHILGDIYDRGPGAHIIMDTLLSYHALDIQWGNHDIVWMGAAAGSEACIANVVRVCLRYANLETLEDGYAISLLPLASFAMNVYGEDPCEQFAPKATGDEEYTKNELLLMARMHKAITVIQMKLEGQVIQRHSEYKMEDRLLLDKIDIRKGTVCLGETEYPLNDTHFPTLDRERPYQLSEEEQVVMDRLTLSFTNSDKLQRHVRFLYTKGSMYLIYNGNLLYHGCINMTEEGEFTGLSLRGLKGDDDGSFSVRAYHDRLELMVRQAYFATDNPEQKQAGMDMVWYLWSGSHSPLFGKDKMATFERYFVAAPETHAEKMNPYYMFRDREDVTHRIMQEFGLDPIPAHIINGHVPVKVKKGESPVKADGNLLVIDGGFSKAYQDKTGIAGYTLIFNSYGLLLASHQPFESTQKAIEEGMDIHSQTEILERNYVRIRVRDTDEGKAIQRTIDELQRLLDAYRAGVIKESG